MRTLLLTLALIITTSLLGAAADPTAIIHTTAGDLHCTLLPKVAPIGVENFIGLANGTKDWTSPISHEKSTAFRSMTAPSSIASSLNS
jgi:hypothetical protein